jgi:3-methyladenine DNA glycosylase AlkD
VESTSTLVGSVPINEIRTLEHEIVGRLNSLPSSTVADLRKLRREFSKRTANFSATFVVQLALELLKNSSTPRFFAYELVQHHTGAAASLNSRTIEMLGEGIDSWASVDTFACYLSGPAWREHQLPDSLIARWTRSKNRWWRRAAVVSTVPLNNKARGGRGDVERTIQICRLVVDDRDDMVVKALSWALRELSKRNKRVVEAFLREFQSRVAPRVLREVKNKLRTGLKNPKLGGT